MSTNLQDRLADKRREDRVFLAFIDKIQDAREPRCGKLRNLRLRTWNSSPSPKTDFRACILDKYAYSHESGHVWKIAGFLVNVSVELWYFWEYMGQSWNMWHPTAIVAQAIRQRIPRMFFCVTGCACIPKLVPPKMVLRSGGDADVKSMSA